MEKDRVFAAKRDTIKPFEFNEQVAGVFDDMLNRSVPLYGESIRRQAQLADLFYREGTRIYDFGCSHGNLGMLVLKKLQNRKCSMIAVDNSISMIQKYRSRLEKRNFSIHPDLVCCSMDEVKIENASVALINLTLQFLEKKKRDAFIQKIYNGLVDGGVLILTEKTIHPVKELDDLQTDMYTHFKLENGYSDLEISQKRDALEKVLVPESIFEHENRIMSAGFTYFDVWLRWFNFVSMIAVKRVPASNR